MKSSIICRSLIVLALAAPFAANASPLGAKPGAWEDNNTVVMTGLMKAIPPKVLESMSPEQRSRIRAMDGTPQQSTSSSCIKKTDTVKSLLGKDSPGVKCTRKIVSQTASSVKINVSCSGVRNNHKISFSGYSMVTAKSHTHFVSEMVIHSSNGIKTHVTSDSHWTSDTCPATAGQ